MTANVFAIKKLRNEIVSAGLNTSFEKLGDTLETLFMSLLENHNYTKSLMIGVVKELEKKAPMGAQDPAVILATAIVDSVCAVRLEAHAGMVYKLQQERKRLEKEIAKVDQDLESARSDRELFYYSEENLLNYGQAAA